MAIPPEILKIISQWLKYIGIALTSGISLHSLGRETFDKERRVLTKPGRRHRNLLIASGLLALVSALVENDADKKLKEIATKNGDRAFQGRLAASNQELVEALTPRLSTLLQKQEDGTTRSINRIDLAARALKQTISETNPLDSVHAKITLSNFEKIEITYPKTGGVANVAFVTDKIDSKDWNEIVCSRERAMWSPWQMVVPISSTIEMVLGNNSEMGDLRNDCNIPAFVRVEPASGRLGAWGGQPFFRHSNIELHLSSEIAINQLPESAKWSMHLRSLDRAGSPDLMMEPIPGKSEMQLIPRKVEVEITAVHFGMPSRKVVRTYQPGRESDSWFFHEIDYVNIGQGPKDNLASGGR
ncbi:MAG: hypothetical protein LAO20_04520 [Acidobacteriia bacterium]|nr:hypothetical protein [Terriglobia bacterium]